jgi:hypothetical protein
MDAAFEKMVDARDGALALLREIQDASGPASGLLERPEATWLREVISQIDALLRRSEVKP